MMDFGSLIVAAGTAKAGTKAASSGDPLALYGSFIWIILIVAVFYFFLIRPQKKKEKKAQHLRESVQVGDNVTTNGGIMGRVVSLKEDSIVIETGADRSKMQVKKWAIQSVDTIHDDK